MTSSQKQTNVTITDSGIMGRVVLESDEERNATITLEYSNGVKISSNEAEIS